VPAAPDRAPVRGEIVRELDGIHDRHAPALDGIVESRLRTGELGLGALADLRQSVAAELPIALRGRATLRATEIELDAGIARAGASSRFGTGTGALGEQRVAGTELRAAYEDRDVVADFGTSPIGFPVFSLLGGVRLRHAFGDVRVSVEGARRPVIDSMLSFAGVQDPATGRFWGGVVTEGGRMDLAYAPQFLTVWGYASLDRLLGFHVAENRRIAGGAGFAFRVGAGELGEISAGATVTGMAFDRNLSLFTWGQGGYFSPQQFLHAGVPVGWKGGRRFRWEVVAEPGYHWFRQDATAVFPLGLPPGASDDAAAHAGDVVPGSRTAGFAFDGRATLGLTITRGLEATATGAWQTAPEYRELRASAGLRYLW
jgi:hypothetical protein